MLKLTLKELENTKFPMCTTRKNISDDGVEAFVLGDVNYRGQKSVDYKTRGPSKYNIKFKDLFKTLKLLINEYKPDFEDEKEERKEEVKK